MGAFLADLSIQSMQFDKSANNSSICYIYQLLRFSEQKDIRQIKLIRNLSIHSNEAASPHFPLKASNIANNNWY